MPKLFKFICQYCGKKFENVIKESIYCSRDCYHKSTIKGKKIKCPTCGKDHYLCPSQLKRGYKYCSRKCYLQDNHGEKITKICKICKKEFEVYKCIEDRFQVCSIECRHKFVNRKTCKRCGKEFYDRPNDLRKYCSELCRRPPVYFSCLNCGKKTRRGPSANSKRFCSFMCYRKYTGETSIEKKIRLALQSLGYSFIQEYQIGKLCVDFAIPLVKIAIEVDGKYWHQNTEEKDQKKEKRLVNRGWKVIRFAEDEINETKNLSKLVYRKVGLPKAA